MYLAFDHIGIKAISSCVPKRVVGNSSFTNILTEKEIRIFEKTVGIKERRWASAEITASDLGYKAADELFKSNKFLKEEIKCLIFLSQTSDYKIPFTSNILQARLGLSKDILCLDLNAGCAGFIQGLSTAYSICNGMEDGSVLFIVAETLSKILSNKDRGTSMLFGDGASALIISKDKENVSKSYFNFFSDGNHSDAIQIPDGGYRGGLSEKSFLNVEREAGNFRTNLNLQMDGQRVFDFTLREISPSITDLLNHFKLSKNDISYFFFHQSNRFIVHQIASQLNLDKEKVPMNIEQFGNTSGVSLSLLLNQKTQTKEPSYKAVFSGYGAGLSWGNAMLEIDEHMVSFPLIEY